MDATPNREITNFINKSKNFKMLYFMKFIKKICIHCLGCLVIGLIVILNLSCSPPSTRQSAPEFVFKNLNGEPISLNSQRGRIVLLNFWATWCSPCRQELPILIDIFNKFSGKNFSVLGVTLNSGELAIDLWIENFKVPYPILVANDTDKEILDQYGVDKGIPRSVLIDREGYIHKTYRGLIELDEFEKDIDNLLTMEKKI